MEELKQYEHRNQLIMDLNNLIGHGKGVEIGVFKGEFSNIILNHWGGTLYMVDVWRELGDEYLDESNNKLHHEVYKNTMNNIKGHEDRGIMIRATSKEASKMFNEESLDFIYIDANHSYDFVVEDINLWFPKLKKGGVMSGHDYINIDWYNDNHWLPNGKDKPIFTYIVGDNGEITEHFFSGEFGVNPAVDEFCKEHNYKVNLTQEWYGTWWIIK